jgi:hypothetical protein
MPARTKIDVVVCEQDYRAGRTMGWLAKRHGVSTAAIRGRVKRHGWVRDAEAATLAETSTGRRLADPSSPADRRLIATGQRSLVTMQRVLDALRLGAPRSTAAALVGLTGEALRGWLADDAEFGRLAAAAEADVTLRRLGRLEAAGTAGDVQTDRWLLERSPSSRSDFAPSRDPGPGDGAGVTINLVLGQGGALVQRPGDAAQVIEIAEQSRAARSLS